MALPVVVRQTQALLRTRVQCMRARPLCTVLLLAVAPVCAVLLALCGAAFRLDLAAVPHGVRPPGARAPLPRFGATATLVQCQRTGTACTLAAAPATAATRALAGRVVDALTAAGARAPPLALHTDTSALEAALAADASAHFAGLDLAAVPHAAALYQRAGVLPTLAPCPDAAIADVPRNASWAVSSGLGTLCDALQRALLPDDEEDTTTPAVATTSYVRALPGWRANAEARVWALESALCVVPALWAVAQHAAGVCARARASGRAARLVLLGAWRSALALAGLSEALALALYTGVLAGLGGVLGGALWASDALVLALATAPLAGLGAALFGATLAAAARTNAVRTAVAAVVWAGAPVVLAAAVPAGAPGAVHAVLAVLCTPYALVVHLVGACTRAYAGAPCVPLGTPALVLCMAISVTLYAAVAAALCSGRKLSDVPILRKLFSRLFKTQEDRNNNSSSSSSSSNDDHSEEQMELLGASSETSTEEGEAQEEERQVKGTIKTDKLTKVYHTKGQEDVVALRDVSVAFAPGAITGLLGENGAGKSTLLAALCGTTAPTRGTASVRGAVGVCPQHDVFFGDLTAPQHIQLVAALRGVPELRTPALQAAAWQQLLDACSLPAAEHRGRPVRTFSAGMQRKLGVACALVGDPAAVLLDEPTGGVDVAARRAIWAALRRLRAAGRTLVLATHAMDEAAALCDDVYVLHGGRVCAHGTPDALGRAVGAGCTLTFDLEAGAEVEAVQPRLAHALTELFGQCTPTDAGPCTLAFRVPLDARERYPEALAGIEDEAFRREHRIRSFALSVCTLQDAFEHFCAGTAKGAGAAQSDSDDDAIGVLDVDEDVPPGVAADSSSSSSSSTTSAFLRAWKPWWAQFKAVTHARLLQYTRDLSYALGMTLLVALEFLAIFGVLVAIRAELNGNAGKITIYNASALGPAYPAAVLPYYITTSTTGASNESIAFARRVVDTVARSFTPPPTPTAFGSAALLDAFVAQSASTTGARYPFALGFDVGVGETGTGTDTDTLAVEFMYNESVPLALPAAINTYYRAVRALRHAPGRVDVALHVVGEPAYISPTAALDPVRIAAFLAPALVLFLASTKPLEALCRERTTGFFAQLELAGLRHTVDVLAATLTGGCGLLAAGAVVALLVAACRVYPIAAASLVPLALGTAAYAFAQAAYAAYFVTLCRRARSTAFVQLAFVLATLVVTYVCYVATRTTVYLLATDDTIAHSTYQFWRFAVLPAELLFPTFAYLNLLINLLMYPAGTPLRVFFGWKSYAAVDVLCLVLSTPILAALAVARRHKKDHIARDPPAAAAAALPASTTGDAQAPAQPATVSRAVIDFERVSKVYLARGRAPFVAVAGLDLSVAPGERLGLLGPNGSGKTTTVGMLTAQLPLSAGTVALDGVPQGASRAHYYARARFGHCPQRGGHLGHLTCHEHLALLAAVRASRRGCTCTEPDADVAQQQQTQQQQQQVRALEHALGLADCAAKRTGTLSGGTVRRLCAAAALLDGTRVAVLDEPSTGLDVVAQQALWARVRAQRSGGAVVLTTHSVAEAEHACTRIGVLVRGRLAHVGTVQELKTAFGTGYVVSIAVRPECPAALRDHRALLAHAAADVHELPTARPHADTRVYRTGPVRSLAALFHDLERARNDPATHIADYTVTQATLESTLAHLFETSSPEDDADSP